MLEKVKILKFIGEKILDQVIDGSVDEILDEKAKQNLIQEYEKIKEEVTDNLLKHNINENYYEYLDKLISETRIVDIIFNLSYMFCDLSKEERKTYLNSYVDDFFQGRSISREDLSTIKGKILQQYDFCFSNLNRPDEKSRKVINQIILHIANSTNEQKKIINELKCETEDIAKILKDVIKMLSVSNLDLENLHESVGMSLENLKSRFSRDFNVDVELSDWINKFCNTNINRENLFKDINELRRAVGNNTLVDNKTLIKHVSQEIDKIKRNQEFSYDLLEHEIEKFIADTEEALERKYKNTKSNYYQSNEYYSWRLLCSINNDLEAYRNAMQSDVLIITGEAGVGKSHSIAQFVNNTYFVDNKPCVFLLGQHLNENVNPLMMLEKSLHLPYTLQSFLEELNLYALSKNIEIPFVIEGINEGRYSEIWKEYLYGLIEIFSRFKKIKLIISIRKTYIKKCIPEGYEKKDNLLIIEHRGFKNNPLESISLFFEYYEINMPTFPILYSDFYNPLFLHTLCKTICASGNLSIEEYSSFTEVFVNYIKVVEIVVAQKCNYRENLKLVQKVVNEVVRYSLNNNLQYGIEIDTFYKIAGDVVSIFGICLTDFVQAMIDSGLFYTEMYGYKEEEEYVQFAYERYHNILTAQYILKDINTLEE